MFEHCDSPGKVPLDTLKLIGEALRNRTPNDSTVFQARTNNSFEQIQVKRLVTVYKRSQD
jgi:hypothetical protein